jgi:hypothetical protein
MKRAARIAWSLGAVLLATTATLWWRWGEAVFVSALGAMLC